MNIDDPKLTAFALGELDEAERREVEALLQEDPAAAAEVAQVREFSTMVRTIMAAEAAPGLAPAQRNELLSGAENDDSKIERMVPAEDVSPRSLRMRTWVPSAIAALVMVSAWYVFLFHREDAGHRGRAAFESNDLAAPNVELQPEPAPAQPGVQLRKLAVSNSGSPAPLAGVPMPTTPPPNGPVLKLDGAFSNKPVPLTADALKVDDSQAASPQVTFRGQANSYSGTTMGERNASVANPMPHFADLNEPVMPAPSGRDGADKLMPDVEVKAKVMREAPRNAPADASRVSATRSAAPAAAPLPAPAPTGNRGYVEQQPSYDQPGAVLTYKVENSRDRVMRKDSASKAMADHRLAGLNPMPAEKKLEEYDSPQMPRQFRERTEASNTESYDTVTDNPFLTVKENPLSTFSIDVDTASYANVRRFLTSGSLPPKGAVRIEELINYFTYDYAQPKEEEPFSTNLEVATCPWAPEHRLLRVGLKAREIPREKRPQANLVFLIDVSGSMSDANKLPLVKESLRLLVEQLGPKDTVAIAVYAGASGTVLEPTSDKAEIREALDRLSAGGSTNGGAGIRLAYQLAKRSFDKEKTNRVLLATDGDFNVGTTNQSDLVDLITKEAKSGVFLTVLGFGYGNLKDSTMEKLADKGNGNYAYIDSLAEGRRVLVEQMAGTLITVAKDVKMQIEFNPAQVSGYRLIGYENRVMAKEDFNNDKKDAGEIGAGHTVTALYELVPANMPVQILTTVDPLKYQPKPATPELQEAARAKTATASNELLTLKLRWKKPDAETSTLREVPLSDAGTTWEKSSKDFRWAAGVASFGMLLRESPYKGNATWDSTKELAQEGRGEDAAGYRGEFVGLIERAAGLSR